MSYLVLARKYRPQTFEDLVGQDHVARTLANAIASGRIAHAFLFTGVRGVGKTTSARLLAKCLNCVGPGPAPSAAPTANPCNVCAPCREITAGHDLDVQEIDGASYNGVDEVRRLQEGVSFRPARDRFKIYIVDEVHMLSTNAWNAFLKTLEEPPPHAKFIFATTEVHKVPVTILSRCQRYDFKLISTQMIAGRLGEVLARERIEADEGAIQVLAREAAGSMRDAMSLLDQVIAFSGERLTGDDVTRVLGVPSRRVMHDIASALVRGDAAACITVLESLAVQGFDFGNVARELLRSLRNLVVARVCGDDPGGSGSLRQILDLADEELRAVLALSAQSDPDDLSRLFQGFSRAFDEMAKSGLTRMAVEMTLVRLARRPPLLPLDELLSRVAELERRLGGGPTSPAPAPGRGGGRSPAVGGQGLSSAPSVLPPQAATAPSPGPPSCPPASRTRGALALAPPPPDGLDPAPRSAPASRPVLVRPASPEAAGPAEAWRAIVDRVRAAQPAIASVLEHAVPLVVNRARVAFGFEPSAAFLAAQASETNALAALTRAAAAHFGAEPEVFLETTTVRSAATRTLASLDAERKQRDLSSARAAVAEHPLVREALRIFGAQLRDIKLPPTDGEG